jgi:hypothetical protein
LALAASLSALMASKGYDRVAWLVVCLLFGPVAGVFAVIELAWAVPRRAEVIERGRTGRGDLDVLVVDAGSDAEAKRRVLDSFGDRLRRLTLVRVVPFDGARDVERMAIDGLRVDAASLGHPHAELALLFGVPTEAVARQAREGDYDAVVACSTAELRAHVTATPARLVATAEDADRLLDGSQHRRRLVHVA